MLRNWFLLFRYANIQLYQPQFLELQSFIRYRKYSIANEIYNNNTKTQQQHNMPPPFSIRLLNTSRHTTQSSTLDVSFDPFGIHQTDYYISHALGVRVPLDCEIEFQLVQTDTTKLYMEAQSIPVQFNCMILNEAEHSSGVKSPWFVVRSSSTSFAHRSDLHFHWRSQSQCERERETHCSQPHQNTKKSSKTVDVESAVISNPNERQKDDSSHNHNICGHVRNDSVPSHFFVAFHESGVVLTGWDLHLDRETHLLSTHGVASMNAARRCSYLHCGLYIESVCIFLPSSWKHMSRMLSFQPAIHPYSPDRDTNVCIRLQSTVSIVPMSISATSAPQTNLTFQPISFVPMDSFGRLHASSQNAGGWDDFSIGMSANRITSRPCSAPAIVSCHFLSTLCFFFLVYVVFFKVIMTKSRTRGCCSKWKQFKIVRGWTQGTQPSKRQRYAQASSNKIKSFLWT